MGYNNRIKNNQISRHIGYDNRIKNNQISRQVINTIVCTVINTILFIILLVIGHWQRIIYLYMLTQFVPFAWSSINE